MDSGAVAASGARRACCVVCVCSARLEPVASLASCTVTPAATPQCLVVQLRSGVGLSCAQSTCTAATTAVQVSSPNELRVVAGSKCCLPLFSFVSGSVCCCPSAVFALRCFPCSCAVTTKYAFPHALRGLRRVLGVQCSMLVCRACAPVRWHCASRCMRRTACRHFPMHWCRPSQATAVAATWGVPARTCTCTFCATSVSR